MSCKETQTLDRRLDTYCAIAQNRARVSPARGDRGAGSWKRFAAATGATLAGVASADGAINHVMPPTPIRVEMPIGGPNDIKQIDLDVDGSNDMRIGAVSYTDSYFYGYRYLGAAQGTASGVALIGRNGGNVRRFASNSVIPAAAPSSTGYVVRMSATSFYNIAFTQGEWSVNDTAFAGFVFGPAGSKRAGWIQIRTDSIKNPSGLDRLGALEIVQWAYETMPGVSIMAGQMSSVSVPGDYDNNGTVGPEDYTAWKNSFGQSVPAGTGADGSGNAVVDAADYTVWRDHFNAPGSGALAGEVPEPATVSLGVLALGAAGVAALRRRSK
jgi:PEP-CTERM motif